jgi:mannose-1-phosphate guanylyltransferase
MTLVKLHDTTNSIVDGFVLILAGGQGTRLWPLSRRNLPKQFLSFSHNDRSMLQETARRAVELTGSWENTLVVSLVDQAADVRQQLPDLPAANLLLEPVSRNTAASIGLGALTIHQRNPDGVMLVFPADHVYPDEKTWAETIAGAVDYAHDHNALVAIGITPTEPSSKYGYLQLGNTLEAKTKYPIYEVNQFIEKPEQKQAAVYIDNPRYVWNTGTYAWKITEFLRELKLHLPHSYDLLERIAQNPADMENLYPKLENISIDYSVMEKSQNLVAVKGIFKRIDIGNLATLAQILPEDENSNALFGQVLCNNSTNNIAYTDKGLIGLIGLENMIVIRHQDIVLVCPKSEVDRVKELLSSLDDQGLGQYK